MYIYVLFLIILLIAYSFEKRTTKEPNVNINENNKYPITTFIGFIFLLLIFALRHPSMGNDLRYLDSNGYLGSFDLLSRFSLKQVINMDHFLNYERGYLIFNKIISLIWNNRQFFLSAVAFCSLYPVYRLIKNNSAYPVMSYFIYFGIPVFLMQFSGLRQILAIGICLISFTYIQKKKPIWFILLVLLATTFHSSAFVFFIAYPLYYLKLDKTKRIISLVIIGIVYVFKNLLFAIFASLFKETAKIHQTGALTLLLVFVLIYALGIIFYKEDEKLNGYMNLFYMACIAQCFGGIYDLALRVGYYFMMFLPLLLPQLVSKMDDKSNRTIFFAGILICFGLFGLYSLSTSTWAMANPYHFFWQSVV